MSLDKIKSLKAGGYSFKNPYVEKKDHNIVLLGHKGAEKDNPVFTPLPNKIDHLTSMIYALKRELSDMRFDIVTILTIIEEDKRDMTMLAIREKYYKFRASEEHVMNRIVDKGEEVINNEIYINDKQTDV